jgi:DNA-binding CsgD family transcriptional regulator
VGSPCSTLRSRSSGAERHGHRDHVREPPHGSPRRRDGWRPGRCDQPVAARGETRGQLDAQPLLQQINQLARRARIELTPDSSPTGSTPFGLTPRELQVLRLIAAGLSNRQIAAELFISIKTASVHVSNILGKLGVPSRGEAAATAHRLHIFDARIPEHRPRRGVTLA